MHWEGKNEVMEECYREGYIQCFKDFITNPKKFEEHKDEIESNLDSKITDNYCDYLIARQALTV